MGVSKLPKLGLPRLWGPIILHADLRLRWGLKQSCSPCREISNDMSQATCMQRNQVNSRLLMVGSQTANLTPDLSFGHNLCFRCPNWWCKPVLDICVLRAFPWYKELFEPLNFDPCNFLLKIRLHLPKWELPGSLRVHSLTLFTLPRTCDVTFGLPSWPATLQALCLGREPKARVTTLQHHEWVNFSKGNQVNYLLREWRQNHQAMGWWLFKWRCFMNMMTGGRMVEVKKRYLDHCWS